MIFEIKHRFTESVLFSLETESLKLCVEAAVKSGADLSRADLSRADLNGADLGGADLNGADLNGADLNGADLNGADLNGAYLGGAYLNGAYLGGAYLGGAYLGGAYLNGADLSRADLSRAYLNGAYLSRADLNGADLSRADLSRAKIQDDITITKAPIQISGLEWLVTIWDQHMQIGCEFHSHDEWRNFTDKDWLHMGSKAALHLKREQFPMLIALCDQHRPKDAA